MSFLAVSRGSLRTTQIPKIGLNKIVFLLVNDHSLKELDRVVMLANCLFSARKHVVSKTLFVDDPGAIL
jgi:hypothetical protein